ncbi:hypothetical protein [Labrys wisconsinensis]|uniref:Uncharacterized protein n=1 Tax=Labrys wisconsinensis TaxID=425677 RepID=A0ABU0J558_9HYPH|nr:hypothetical protein [Labrys wisconsinensis]MDQ0469369.1 hypothetical protein [Labrys wisconsinensis]
MLTTQAPSQRDAAPPAIEPPSPWTVLAHPDGRPLLGARSLWTVGITWLEGGRGAAPARIEARREAELGPGR